MDLFAHSRTPRPPRAEITITLSKYGTRPLRTFIKSMYLTVVGEKKKINYTSESGQ